MYVKKNLFSQLVLFKYTILFPINKKKSKKIVLEFYLLVRYYLKELLETKKLVLTFLQKLLHVI